MAHLRAGCDGLVAPGVEELEACDSNFQLPIVSTQRKLVQTAGISICKLHAESFLFYVFETSNL
jgi:hypothetical protein